MTIIRSNAIFVLPKSSPAFHSNLFLFPRKKEKGFSLQSGLKVQAFCLPTDFKKLRIKNGATLTEIKN